METRHRLDAAGRPRKTGAEYLLVFEAIVVVQLEVADLDGELRKSGEVMGAHPPRPVPQGFDERPPVVRDGRVASQLQAVHGTGTEAAVTISISVTPSESDWWTPPPDA